MARGRPIVYDATHLLVRQITRTPTGIDRVDHAFAAEFSTSPAMTCAVQSLFARPRLLSADRVGRYTQALSRRWGEVGDVEDDPRYRRWLRFIENPCTFTGSVFHDPGRSPRSYTDSWRGKVSVAKALREHDPALRIPEGALYLNVTQSPTLMPRAGRFLRARSDLRGVFLVHDLIPVDWPEFFPAEREAEFRIVLDTMIHHASAFLVTTAVVRERLRDELRRTGRTIPIHVAHLPVPAGFEQSHARDPLLSKTPYVVVVGTVEPRKNHHFLLQLWRQMLRGGDRPPKLVIIGAPGWENEAVIESLARTPEFRGEVLHLAGLGDRALCRIVAHARALLMPSFVEGYGLPVAEAASLGVPVIAHDHPVFAEVSQGRATLIDCLDAPAWRDAILASRDAGSPSRPDNQAGLSGFVVPTAARYFESVRGFLGEI